MTSGRGIVFCQIYQYGDDLYVGWDGHVNIGQWVEEAVVTGIDRATRKPIVLNAVVSGTQPASEYDVMDLSCLVEWTHAQVVKLLKRLIEDQQIDQEIDFHILRGERQTLTTQGGSSAGSSGGRGRLRRMLGVKRTA